MRGLGLGILSCSVSSGYLANVNKDMRKVKKINLAQSLSNPKMKEMNVPLPNRSASSLRGFVEKDKNMSATKKLLKFISKRFESIGYDFKDVWVIWSKAFTSTLRQVVLSLSLSTTPPPLPAPPYY